MADQSKICQFPEGSEKLQYLNDLICMLQPNVTDLMFTKKAAIHATIDQSSANASGPVAL